MTKRLRNALALALALLLASFSAQAGFRWHKDGSVSVDGQRTPTLLYGKNIDAGIETPEGVFLAGYHTVSDSPAIALIPKGHGAVRYWFFPERMLDFFRFQGHLYAYNYYGTVYEYTRDDWALADMQFEKSSIVLHPEAGEDVIVCYPAPQTKADFLKSTGGCQSLARGWKAPLHWWMPPKLCGNNLVAVTVAFREGVRRDMLVSINPADGSLSEPKMLPRKTNPDTLDLCTLVSPRGGAR